MDEIKIRTEAHTKPEEFIRIIFTNVDDPEQSFTADLEPRLAEIHLSHLNIALESLYGNIDDGDIKILTS